MTLYRFEASGLDPYTVYRIDTASGSTTPAAITGPELETITGSQLKAHRSGKLSPFLFTSATLYAKPLTYQGVAGTPVTLTGVLYADAAPPTSDPSIGSLNWGAKIAITGDSIQAGGSGPQSQGTPGNPGRFQHWSAAHLWMSALANGQIYVPVNCGHGGYTSANLAALFDAEVLSLNPDVVIDGAGYNDGLDGSNYPSATLAAMESNRAKCQARGIPYVIATLTPYGKPADADPTVGPTCTVLATGGTLTAGTYYYKYVWVVGSGVTLASPASSAVVIASGSTNSVVVEPPTNGYSGSVNIYRSSDGGTTYGLIGNLNSGGGAYANSWYTDTGTAQGATYGVTNTTAVPTIAATMLRIAKINLLKRWYAAKYRLPIIDLYSAVTDPATGMWKQGYSGEGVHPNYNGNAAMGAAMWNAIKDKFKPAIYRSSFFGRDETNCWTDSANLPNGLFTTNNGQYPSNFGGYGNTNGLTRTVAPRTGHIGNAYSMTKAGSGNQGAYYDQPVFSPVSAAARFIPGHVYQFALTMESAPTGNARGGVSGGFAWKYADNSEHGGFAVAFPVALAPTRWVSWPMICPPLATGISVAAATNGDLGTCAYSDFQMVDLTAAGFPDSGLY